MKSKKNLLLSFLLMIIVACEKQDVSKNGQVDINYSQKEMIKSWLQGESVKLSKSLKDKFDSTISHLRFEQAVHKNSLINNNFGLSVIPFDANNKKHNFLLIKWYKSLARANIVEVDLNSKVNSHDILSLYEIPNKTINGDFLFYSHTGKKIAQLVIKNGNTDTTRLLTTLNKNNPRRFKNKRLDHQNQTNQTNSDELNYNDCIDWYWTTYVDGVLVDAEFLYRTCEGRENDTEACNGCEMNGDNNLTPIYICANSFDFKSQGNGSITNVAKTWGINAGWNSNIITFGITTYAPTDVKNFGSAWSYLNSQFYYLVNNNHIWLRTDLNGDLHLMFDAFAQKQIAAAACDYASDNNNNPKNVLDLPNGNGLYKKKFQELYLDFMKAYLPGTTVEILNQNTSGTTIATYTHNPLLC